MSWRLIVLSSIQKRRRVSKIQRTQTTQRCKSSCCGQLEFAANQLGCRSRQWAWQQEIWTNG
jgi:hypothetical protein